MKASYHIGEGIILLGNVKHYDIFTLKFLYRLRWESKILSLHVSKWINVTEEREGEIHAQDSGSRHSGYVYTNLNKSENGVFV